MKDIYLKYHRTLPPEMASKLKNKHEKKYGTLN